MLNWRSMQSTCVYFKCTENFLALKTWWWGFVVLQNCVFFFYYTFWMKDFFRKPENSFLLALHLYQLCFKKRNEFQWDLSLFNVRYPYRFILLKKQRWIYICVLNNIWITSIILTRNINVFHSVASSKFDLMDVLVFVIKKEINQITKLTEKTKYIRLR